MSEQLTDKNMGHFRVHQDDNKELKEMKHQLTEMDHDYDVMLRERIESKKQLEAKFQDIARKIQANKDFTNAEVKRVRDTLKAFTSKFEYKLRLLKEDFEEKIRKMKEHNRNEFRIAKDRMDAIEDSIHKEISDRIIESDEHLNATRADLQAQQRAFDEEVATRIEREKDILQELDDEKYKLHKKIDYERTDKSLKFGAFRDDVKDQLKR